MGGDITSPQHKKPSPRDQFAFQPDESPGSMVNIHDIPVVQFELSDFDASDLL